MAKKIEPKTDTPTSTPTQTPEVTYNTFAYSILHDEHNHRVVRIPLNSTTGEVGVMEVIHETPSRGEAQMAFKIEVGKNDIL